VPGVVVGAVLESTVANRLGAIWLIATMLIVFGLVLALADRAPGRRDITTIGLRDAVAMGFAQALALAPGVSRSGATISAGRGLGLGRDAAARVSFLMSIPITAGAVAYEGVAIITSGGLPAGTGPAFFWGTVSAALTGLGAVWLVLRVVRGRSFTPFVIYRLVAGVAVLAVVALR
ncbi:MAG: undecaprenyl-diphosphate phosphatase, partial [Pseudonocardiaceae bacterium]